MDIIIYNRVSTDNKDQDPESNLGVIKEFASRYDHNIIDIIIDKGVSGDTYYYDRKNGKKIEDYKKTYEEKDEELGIAVFSMDRFSRQKAYKVMYLLNSLREQNVFVLSATENVFNEDSEFSEPIQFNILWFNHYFLVQHSKKVKAGNEKRKRKGLHVGRALIKNVIGKGKNKQFIYYTEEELVSIHSQIKLLAKKKSYRQIKTIMLRDFKVNVSLGYINKVLTS